MDNSNVSSLGAVGVWTMALDFQPAGRVRELAAEVEELGFGALWHGEAFGRDTVSQSWLLLSSTERIVVGAGVANIAVREPVAMAAAHWAIEEAFPGRYVLALGGHRTHDTPPGFPGRHGRAAETMGAYLDAMDDAPLCGAEPLQPGHRLLAALGPMMTELATVRASGVHTYLVPVEHTRRARNALGPDALIAVEQAVALCPDPTTSLSLARDHVASYVGVAPYHRRNLARLGYQVADLDGPSDRLVHDLVAIGDLDAVASRVREQLAAGANHVCLQVLTGDPAAVPVEQWRELADLNVAIINLNDVHPSNPKHPHEIAATRGGDHR